ncbi:hypothetical protein [Alloscardovia criceti]|uniref:hypothetical protein n=1 Tax=Alloscardovia criceti TaxID=356828 RepID=UPI00036B4A48|nr:hypothetical protein [Alloscardovia criceti]
MAENQSNRRSGGRNGKSGGGFGGNRRGSSNGSGRGFSRNGKSGGNRNGGGFRKRSGAGKFNSDRRREDGEERRFDRSEGRNSEGRRSEGRRFEGNGRFDRSDRRDFHGSRRRNDNRSQGGNPRYERNSRPDNERTDNEFRREDGRGDRSRGFSNQRGNHNGRQSSQNYDRPRKNSDGTLSFPSQNPYTDRRPGEPKMPKGLEWSMLSSDEKERLRGLSKEHAENIGLHMLAAYALEEEDPQLAMEHAQWVARQASRVDVSRETLAFVAYRQGNYKLALREFRTAYRMNGYGDYLPFMADCERGLGNPQKAVDIALSDDAKRLRGEAKAELFLVYAGALADLDLFDKAVEVVHTIAHAQGVGGAYRMRAVQAEQNFLELAGRNEEAEKLNDLLDRLEAQYADVDDLDEADVYVDNDLEFVDDDMLEGLGIDPSEFASYRGEAQDEDSEDSEDIEEDSAENSEEDSEENSTDEPSENSSKEENTVDSSTDDSSAEEAATEEVED